MNTTRRFRANVSHPALALTDVSLVFQSVLCPFAIILNIFCLVAIRRCHSLRHQMKLILYNLAATDAVTGWMQLVNAATIKNLGSLGLVGCMLRFGPSQLVLYASMSFTVLLSVDRWLSLKLALRYDDMLTSVRIKITIAGLWLVNVILAVLSLWNPVLTFDECSRGFADDSMAIIFKTVVFFISLFLILLAGIRTFVIARGHIQTIMATDKVNKDAGRRSQRKSTKTVLLVLIAFVVCYTPYFIISLIPSDVATPNSIDSIFLNGRIWFLLINLNSIVNPIIFIYTSRDLKDTVKRLLCRWNQNVRSAKTTTRSVFTTAESMIT